MVLLHIQMKIVRGKLIRNFSLSTKPSKFTVLSLIIAAKN